MSDKAGTFSARWRSGVLDRLDRRSRQLDQSRSRLAERYVDEGLKMDEHPGIIFRDGPTGRRAALPAGPDIWQIVQLLVSSPKKGDSAIAETAELMNLSEARLRLAVSYYASYPEDIDRRIKDNIEGAEAAEAAWLREQAIFGMKLLLDEQISGKVADRLRKMGHDVVAATADPVLRGTSDTDLFEFAQTEKRILVTYDRGDFEVILHRYASYEQEHHGVVFVQQHRLLSRDFNRLAKALDRFDPPPGRSFVVWLQD